MTTRPTRPIRRNLHTGRERRRGSLPVLARLGLVLATAFLVLFPAGAAQAATGEGMDSYTAAYDLQKDGSVQVRERITWRFPAGEERHGIFRNIIVRMGVSGQDGKYRYYDMTDVAVSSPSGAPDAFQVSDNGAAREIRIGSADQYTSGTQVYDVSYTLHNVLNPIAGQDGAANTVEFFYNVFGTNEFTPRDKVSVTVNAPAASTKVLCYQGAAGATTPCQGTTGNPSTFSAASLASGDAMTVVASYPATAFDNPRPDIRDGSSDTSLGSGAASAANAAAWVGGIGAPVVALAVMGTLVWTRGRDERYADVTPGLTPAAGTAAEAPTTRGGRTVVAVQFQPPAGVQPGMVGTIIDETANPIDVSATIIDLAVRGYLRIEEVDGSGPFSRTDWNLTQLPPPADDRLLPYERKLLDGIFASRGDVVALSELKNHFASTLKSIQSAMYEEVVRRHWFRSSPQVQRGVWQGLGLALAVIGGLILFYGRGAIQAVLGSGFTGGVALGVGLLLAGGITWILGGRMAAKTAEGSAVLAQSLGFKEYLTTAEAGQIAFEEASNIFSRYLPYAVVFGVADRWAKTFADVARAAEAANQPLIMPTWYVWSGNVFPDFTSIANGVDSFSTTSTGTFTSTPGSSGASGFGGGGFSGGGGGGSSSGSW
ncbi:hypothetical protein N865_16615 [Intrasporangium oryzae NRRL B-24470]|uniref:DUF2207 domain-containing protein n=1 Tax=Intrasporangium oryzae NRRL B-24470 TaxID=1386089 RepID=W9G606_9MICO|nr:DUF2207 domain-containing protein [Intrasporangium oryzae]EWT00228.1 hypothetical protein N865_16615 [Intrasporangium oryzae NRRL B-24470]